MTEILSTHDALTEASAADLLRAHEDPAARARAHVVPTGFDPLDDVIGGGFRAQDLVLLGGRPGVGKTIAGVQWARTAALQGNTAIYICFEHSGAALLGRLLALELAGIARPDELMTLARLRTIAQEVALGAVGADALVSEPLGEEAYGRVQRYGQRLRFVEASGSRADLAHIARTIEDLRDGPTIVYVDYLQKVAVPGVTEETERITTVTEGLKDLAMSAAVPIVALAAADQDGLTSRRLRLHHLRGSAALAHECDMAIIMNEKSIAVSKRHLAFDITKADQFRHQTVFSVEKNRAGPADMHVDHVKDFASFRFDPKGSFLAEALVDEVIFTE